MKKLIWVIVIIVVIGGIWIAVTSGAPSDVEESTITDPNATTTDSDQDITVAPVIPADAKIDVKSFSFTGYGPGKVEEGTFTSYKVEDLKIQNDKIVGGRFVIDTKSISVKSERLKEHLCSEDFFECATYPQIVFEVMSSKQASDNTYTITGDLTFHGVTKEISFTVLKDEDTYSADFRLDTTPFQFKYVAIDKDVRIQFSGTVTK